MKTSYTVKPQDTNGELQIIDCPFQAQRESIKVLMDTMKPAVITELKIDDKARNIVSTREVTLSVTATPILPTIATIKSGERFNVDTINVVGQLLDSGEEAIYKNGKGHNRLVASIVDSKLTDTEQAKVTQTFSHGDYFDYKGLVYTIVALPTNTIHESILRFIRVS